MRIAILGSVALPVPPPAQGGTEWMAYYQAKGLSQRGHKVILFAAKGSQKGNYELVEVGGGDTVAGSTHLAGPASRVSQTPLQHVHSVHAASREASFGSPSLASPASVFSESSRSLRKENVYLAQIIQKLIDRKDDYDLILNNMRGEAVFLPFAALRAAASKPFVNVMHLPIFSELAALFKTYNTHLITISNSQRRDFPGLNYLATVYNGVDTEKYVMPNQGDKKKDYLLMMGSVTRHKNQAAAIRVARKLGMRLVLAGKINDPDYYKEIEKDIDGEKIKWVGELSFSEKLKLYQNAKAFLFPIVWEEPFGLVMIEAMACGTPVVAYGNGAIYEVVVDGLTGYVIEDHSKQKTLNIKQELKIKKTGTEGLTEAVKTIMAMSEEKYQLLRRNCRRRVEENFTIEKMIESYEKALLKIV